MTPMAATLSWNNDVILLHHTSRLRVCGPRRPFVLLFLHLIVRQPLRNTQHIGHTRRRYGIRLITKSIWSGLTNSEESGEGGWEREIMRDQRSRLTINWIGGGRMRSLNFFFFFHRNGCTEHKGGFHQTHRCTYACALTDNACTENFFFFWAVTLHVSCCYGDASLWSSRSAGLAGEERGRGRQGDFVGGVQTEGVRGEGQTQR